VIRTAWTDLASAVELVRSLSQNVALAEEYLADEEKRKGSYLDILNARRSLATAESNYYRALRDAAVARAQLDWATGAPAQ
jgi:outer membrane protein TolC